MRSTSIIGRPASQTVAGWALALCSCGVAFAQDAAVSVMPATAEELPALGTGGPQSPYIFELSEHEIIETAMFYRGVDVDVDELLDQMSAPFEAAKFGDIEREVGPARAPVIIHRAWDLALRRVPMGELLEEVNHLSDAAYEAHLDETFPDGIPDNDPFWQDGAIAEIDVSESGESSVAADLCSRSSSAETKDGSGKWKVRSESMRRSSGVYNYAKGRGRTYNRGGSLLPWIKTKVDTLDVSLEGEYYNASSLKWIGFSESCKASSSKDLTCEEYVSNWGAFWFETTAKGTKGGSMTAISCYEYRASD